MGGLLSINATWFRGMGSPSESDFNAITKTGFYTIGDISKLSNNPFNGSGMLMVLSGTGFGYILQVLFSSAGLAYRFKYTDAGNWLTWNIK